MTPEIKKHIVRLVRFCYAINKPATLENLNRFWFRPLVSVGVARELCEKPKFRVIKKTIEELVDSRILAHDDKLLRNIRRNNTI